MYIENQLTLAFYQDDLGSLLGQLICGALAHLKILKSFLKNLNI